MHPRKKVVLHPEQHKALREHLLALRVERGSTQGDVAVAMNLSRPQYAALEGGRSLLSFEGLCSLAVFYRRSVSDLLDGVA